MSINKLFIMVIYSGCEKFKIYFWSEIAYVYHLTIGL